LNSQCNGQSHVNVGSKSLSRLKYQVQKRCDIKNASKMRMDGGISGKIKRNMLIIECSWQLYKRLLCNAFNLSIVKLS
jgi:hypothetical protein